MSSFDDIKIGNEIVHTKNGSMNIFGSNISNISTIGKKNKALSISRNSNISRDGKKELKKIINNIEDKYNKKSSSNSRERKKKKGGIYCCGNIFSKCFGK